MATATNKTYTTAAAALHGGRYGISGHQRVAIWGQSNAVGRADGSDLSAAPLSTDAQLAQYFSGALAFSRVFIWTGSAFEVLTATNNQCTSGQFGPEFALAIRWMRQTASGNLYIEKEAVSGVSITTFDPADATYGYSYTSRKAAHNAGTAWLSARGVTISGDHWLWIQGEADAAQSQSWYQTRLQSLMTQRLADGLDTTAGRQILAQMKTGTGGYGAGVAAAKSVIAAATPARVKLITMDYYKSDALHCNGRGQVQLGYDAFEQIFGTAHIAT